MTTTVADYIKIASAVIVASKKNDFVMSGFVLGFDQANLAEVTSQTKQALKKLTGYQNLMA